MLKHIDQEDRRIMRPIARAEAEDFLVTQLKKVDAKIRSQREYLENYYSPDDERRYGGEQMLKMYVLEKEIIEELVRDSQDEILPDIFHRRLPEIERQLYASRQTGSPSLVPDSGYWQLRRKAEILKDLLRRWNQRFRGTDLGEEKE